MSIYLRLLAMANDESLWPRRFSDSWLEIVAAVGAAVAFGLGLCQYVRAQTWQRTQFLAEEVAKFRSHVLVSKAIAMLDDYKERDIDLFDKEEDRSKRIVSVTPEMVCRALAEQDEYGTDDARVCDAIRDAFDAFFDGLERFECFIAAKLLTAKQLQPFLVYWIEQFADGVNSRKGTDLVTAARSYIDHYYFDEVQNLCERFGHDLRANKTAGDGKRSG